MNSLWTSLRMLFVLTLLTGLAYPLLVTGIGQTVFPHQANGGLIDDGGKIVGSDLIGQKFESPVYFWGRPSGVDFNPAPSGGTNLGSTSAALKTQVEERRAKMQAAHPGGQAVPAQLLFTSASGVDPEIAPGAIIYQIERVAQARGVPADRIRQVVDRFSKPRQLGFLGEPRVNVLALNLELDREFGKKGQTP
jgi:K+-transporting ATPase ATPase C chain